GIDGRLSTSGVYVSVVFRSHTSNIFGDASVRFPSAPVRTSIDSGRSRLLTMSKPRVLLAEDHRDTAELLRGLLQTEFDVVAQVEDGLALVSAVERLSPDVI